MRLVIELEDGVLGEVLNMYNADGQDAKDRSEAEAIVVRLANGTVLHGEVVSPEGIYPVH